MERITISASDDFAAELAAFMTRNGYDNRSEALRDLARLGLKRTHVDQGLTGRCVATLTYVFNHHTRELARRLTNAQHEHHDMQIATLHVHLDHENCLEVAVLRGDAADVRGFAQTVIAQRGVTHGELSVIPVTTETTAHGHGGSAHPHAHAHPETEPSPEQLSTRGHR